MNIMDDSTEEPSFLEANDSGSLPPFEMNALSSASKRLKLSDEDKSTKGFDAPKNPPHIKRSFSMIVESHEPHCDSESLVSPKRGEQYAYAGFYRKQGKKPVLQRSASCSDLHCKQLSFADDHGTLRAPMEYLGERRSNASEDSISSLSTDSGISTRQEEQEELKKWHSQTLLKRRRVSGSMDDSMLNTTTNNETSPVPFGHRQFAEPPTIDDHFLRKMSHLDVKKMGPPATLLLPKFQFAGIPPEAMFVGTYETPTREQAMLKQCEDIDATELVAECKKHLRVVVLDLDETLLDIHTKGVWNGNEKALGEHIRPAFRVLVPLLLSAGIFIGIATFSRQEDLVENMLLHVFGNEVRLEENVFVRGSRAGDERMSSQESFGDFLGHEEEDDGDSGKRKHIQCILTRLEPFAKDVAPNQILFIDDDENNTTAAKKDGHVAVQFRDSWTDALFLRNCVAAIRLRHL